MGIGLVELALASSRFLYVPGVLEVRHVKFQVGDSCGLHRPGIGIAGIAICSGSLVVFPW